MHVEIVRSCVEEETDFIQMAETLGRSSRTPLIHIQKHNRAVERSGFCPICRRNKAVYEGIKVKRSKKYSFYC